MSQITNIRESLAKLSSALQTMAETEKPAVPEATINSISGNAIHGGKITLLRSTGIRDQATRTSLLVEDDQITVGTVDTCLLYTSPSPRDQRGSRMPSSA